MISTSFHPFIIGLLIGGCLFGGALGIIGWALGYDAAMRKVGSWMRPKINEAHGDVPTLPPDRSRRWIPSSEGRS